MTTIEEARVAGIERFRAVAVQEYAHRRLSGFGVDFNKGQDTAGTKWERATADRLGAKVDMAKTFLTEVLGVSYRELNAITKDAQAEGTRKAEEMARLRGWLPVLEEAA